MHGQCCAIDNAQRSSILQDQLAVIASTASVGFRNRMLNSRADQFMLALTTGKPLLLSRPAGRRGLAVRNMSAKAQRPSTGRSWRYEQPGEPADVLKLDDRPVVGPQSDEILVKFLMAPVNPADVLTVQGVYPLQPSTGIPGHEGVAEVLEVGSEVQGFEIGDHVVPMKSAQGTWQQYGTFPAALWHRVPRDLPLPEAATLCINPPTALGMLTGFVNLQPGDVVVQNVANSAVGKLVIRIAKTRGWRTVNIIRNRPDWDEVVAELKGMGADVVATEETVEAAAKEAGMEGAALALNAVGGSVATTMANMLRKGGILVTYGAMTMQPVPVSPLALIFNDVQARGFWISGAFSSGLGEDGMRKLLDDCVSLYQQGVISAEVEEFPLADMSAALNRLGEGQLRRKLVFRMDS